MSAALAAQPEDTGPPTRDPRWARRAECLGCDPNLFHPVKLEEQGFKKARAVCLVCPVRFECLVEALENKEQYGVWGGTSERARRALRRRVAAGENPVNVAWDAMTVSGGR